MLLDSHDPSPDTPFAEWWISSYSSSLATLRKGLNYTSLCGQSESTGTGTLSTTFSLPLLGYFNPFKMRVSRPVPAPTDCRSCSLRDSFCDVIGTCTPSLLLPRFSWPTPACVRVAIVTDICTFSPSPINAMIHNLCIFGKNGSHCATL